MADPTAFLLTLREELKNRAYSEDRITSFVNEVKDVLAQSGQQGHNLSAFVERSRDKFERCLEDVHGDLVKSLGESNDMTQLRTTPGLVHAAGFGGIHGLTIHWPPKIPNPSKTIKCAACVAAWAAAAAAIAAYAASTGGIGVVALQGWIVAEYGVSSDLALEAASAAVACGSAGSIAYCLCPDCK